MKGIIIYNGKYGATKQYANWLADELNFPVFKAGEEETRALTAAGIVIAGTSIYIGKLRLKKWLAGNQKILKGKKIFLFLVAGTPPEQKEKLDGYIQANVPGELLQQCEVFYFPGRLVINKLSWTDRFLLKMGARMAKDPDDRKNMVTDYDHVERERITALVDAVRKFDAEKVF